MKLDRVFQIFVPKDKKFYPLFVDLATNLVKTSKELENLLQCTDDNKIDEWVHTIKKLENKGDNLTSKVYDTLNSTFLTPFDREDIQKMVNRIDSVVDLIYTAAKRVQLYRLKELPPVFIRMAHLVTQATIEIETIIRGLNDMHDLDKFRQNCKTISVLENESDDLNYSFLSEIWDTETNAILLLKKRDILNALEKAMDRCEDVGDVLQTVIVKHA